VLLNGAQVLPIAQQPLHVASQGMAPPVDPLLLVLVLVLVLALVLVALVIELEPVEVFPVELVVVPAPPAPPVPECSESRDIMVQPATERPTETIVPNLVNCIESVRSCPRARPMSRTAREPPGRRLGGGR
jgi:hypothetical protein